MSIRIPPTGHTQSGGDTVATDHLRIQLGAGAGSKAANTGFCAFMFIRHPEDGHVENVPRGVMIRALGGTGGNDGYIRFQSGFTDVLEWSWRSGGTSQGAGTLPSPLVRGKAYMIGLIVTAGYVHVVAAPTDGGAVIRNTFTGGTFYATAMTSTEAVTSLGGSTGVNKGYYGQMEEFFSLTGLFPETSGVPDLTLISNLASGAQSIDGLDALMTGGARKARYRMRTKTDLTDAWAVSAAATLKNEDLGNRKLFISSGPLHPSAHIKPNHTRDQVSQAVFANPDTLVGATGTVKTEGGTYNTGLGVASIRARLIGVDTATVHKDWTTVDAAPSGGTFVAGQLTGVPAVAEFLTLQFAGFNSGGTQVTDTINSRGLRGVGFHVVNTGQSQLMQLYQTGTGIAVPSGINFISGQQSGKEIDGTVTTGVLSQLVLGPLVNIQYGAARGIRQAAIEINAKFPGLPIQFTTVGESGQTLNQFAPISAANVRVAAQEYYYPRWAQLVAALGMMPPYLFQPVGHSSIGSGDYKVIFGEMVAEVKAKLGNPLKTIIVPVPRYGGAGTGGSYTAVQTSRVAMRTWARENPTDVFQGASHAVVKTTEVGSDPHPSDDAKGQGRSGALLGWEAMMAAAAVPDHRRRIVSAKRTGTTLKVKIGAIV